MNMSIRNDDLSLINSLEPMIRLHLWLETDDGVFFGAGRAQLLQKIERYGSLKQAAEHMGMSYRGAWGKIKKTEDVLGDKLIVKISNKEGYQLTELGREFVRLYLKWYNEVEKFAAEKAREIFPWNSRQYIVKKAEEQMDQEHKDD